MTDQTIEPTPHTDPPTLLGTVESELLTTQPSCGATQPEVPENVCVRDQDHPGPHVAKADDGTFLQFEA